MAKTKKVDGPDPFRQTDEVFDKLLAEAKSKEPVDSTRLLLLAFREVATRLVYLELGLDAISKKLDRIDDGA